MTRDDRAAARGRRRRAVAAGGGRARARDRRRHVSAGSRLPGEIEIAERFGVNRHTVRRALATLAERGLVRAERGSGTYVEAQRIPYPIRARTRFSEIVGASGRAAGGRMIASARKPPTASLRRGSPSSRARR